MEKCHGCDRVSTVLIPVKLWTVFPAHGDQSRYIEHFFCPECLIKDLEYFAEVCHPRVAP